MTLLITSLIIAAALAIYFTVKDKPKEEVSSGSNGPTYERIGLMLHKKKDEEETDEAIDAESCAPTKYKGFPPSFF